MFINDRKKPQIYTHMYIKKSQLNKKNTSIKLVVCDLCYNLKAVSI